MKKFLMVLLAVFSAESVQADVQLKIKDARGQLTTISSNGQKARIDSKMMPGYVIIDYGSGEFLMVDAERKEVMKSTLGGSAAAVSEQLKIDLKDSGNGPQIAGYATRQMDLTVNGQQCGSFFTSKALLAEKGISELFGSMRRMQQQSRGMTGGMGSMMNPCQRANMQLADAFESNGAPLRIVDDKGQIQSEVLEVITVAKLASSHYQVPAGMKVVNMDEKMGQAKQQTQQIMQQMPELQTLIQQMQKSGQMTPEMMKQIQQMQQQLQ